MTHSDNFKKWMNKDGAFTSADDYVRYLNAASNTSGINVFETTDPIKLNQFEKGIMSRTDIQTHTKVNYNSALNKYKEFARTIQSQDITPDFNEVFNYEFNAEHFGKSSRQIKQTDFDRRHGIIVNALEKALKAIGHKTGNNRNIDLFVHQDNEIKKLFEIKTTSSTQSLYSAVGQLLIYSIPISNVVDLILVSPDKLKDPVVKRLAELRIKILYFDFNNGTPIFQKLNEIL